MNFLFITIQETGEQGGWDVILISSHWGSEYCTQCDTEFMYLQIFQCWICISPEHRIHINNILIDFFETD